MPYLTTEVDAELFIEHDGVKVYHTYKDDEIEQGVNFCFYTLDPVLNGDERDDIDVRELAKDLGMPEPYFLDDEAKKSVFIAAINAKLIGDDHGN
jgi:hypothetical protein